MKVSDTPVAVPAATTRIVAGSGQTKELEQKSPIQDKVSVSSPQDSAALQTVRAVSSGRSARVQEIINAVKSGQYYPSPQQIAQQLVSEAEIDAHIQAMLAR